MLHPPGPGKVYPEVAEEYEAFLDGIVYDMEQEEKQRIIEGVASGLASGLPDIDSVIETPPEWGRPDEGTPNQPRRPPEYNPPQVSNACRLPYIAPQRDDRGLIYTVLDLIQQSSISWNARTKLCTLLCRD